MNLVVFTAAFGDTDAVRAPRVIDSSVRYLCFGDQQPQAPYEWIRTEASNDPRMDARRVKILAEHPALQAADATLWHDASYQLQRNLGWVRRGLQKSDVLAMRHPRRVRIEDEAPIIVRYGYLSLDVAEAHVARYRADGFTDNVLTVTGLLARRMSSSIERFNLRWWDEVQHWNGRDQASVDYAAWRCGLRVAHIPGTIKNNRCAAWRVPQVRGVAA